MCPSGATCLPADCWFQWDGTLKIQLCVGLVQSGSHHHHFIECNLFSPRYSWKIAHLAWNNNHSLTKCFTVFGLNMPHEIYHTNKSCVLQFLSDRRCLKYEVWKVELNNDVPIFFYITESCSAAIFVILTILFFIMIEIKFKNLF